MWAELKAILGSTDNYPFLKIKLKKKNKKDNNESTKKQDLMWAELKATLGLAALMHISALATYAI